MTYFVLDVLSNDRVMAIPKPSGRKPDGSPYWAHVDHMRYTYSLEYARIWVKELHKRYGRIVAYVPPEEWVA